METFTNLVIDNQMSTNYLGFICCIGIVQFDTLNLNWLEKFFFKIGFWLILLSRQL